MLTDEELMISYKMGSEESFNSLYEKYSSMVYGYISKRLGPAFRDDFYQKVWRHLHEKRSLYQGTPFAPWFFVLIKNLLIDEYRSMGRKKEFEANFIDHLVKDSENMEVDLEELLNTLGPQIAQMVRQFYLEGMSYEELSKQSGLSETSLRQRMSRGIRALRQKIRGEV